MILLYYLSQKDDFFESIKPLLGNIKTSENMLKFLNDLNRFSEMFAMFKGTDAAPKKSESPPPKEGKKTDSPKNEKSQSPISGIANDFIQQSLDAYFKKRS